MKSPARLDLHDDDGFGTGRRTDPRQVATTLIGQVSEEWSSGTAADRAMEAFALARTDAYGLLPTPGDHVAYTLSQSYVEQAVRDVALQLSRVGFGWRSS
jgi:hypothetical protein